jgi:hypothetical protein
MTGAARPEPGLRGPALAATLTGLACIGLGGPAAAHDGLWPFDDEPFFEIPPTLPEGINGVIRSTQPVHTPQRVDRIVDVFAAMRGCWQPPGGPPGQQITVRLSFKRNGEAFGRPRVTYSQAQGEREAHRRFRASVFAALDRCMRLPFTTAFGSAIAGRPFTFRFVDDRPA